MRPNDEPTAKPLDDYEVELEGILAGIDFSLVPPATQEEKDVAAQVARNTIATMERKDTKISLRLNKSDLTEIKAEALKQGLPYQTLISSILHQYAKGRMKIV